jgi:hypothetical protein
MYESFVSISRATLSSYSIIYYLSARVKSSSLVRLFSPLETYYSTSRTRVIDRLYRTIVVIR